MSMPCEASDKPSQVVFIYLYYTNKEIKVYKMHPKRERERSVHMQLCMDLDLDQTRKQKDLEGTFFAWI